MCKFHRDAIDIPSDPVERRELVRWLLDHPMWKRPIGTYHEPPEGVDIEKWMNGELDTSNWIVKETIEGDINECVDFFYTYVNPETNCVEEDDSLNTKFQVWADTVQTWEDYSLNKDIEPPEEGWDVYNKWRLGGAWLCLECGGDTMEECLLNLAVRIKLHFDDNGAYKNIEWCEGEYDDETDIFTSACIDAGDGYCKVCGFAMDE